MLDERRTAGHLDFVYPSKTCTSAGMLTQIYRKRDLLTLAMKKIPMTSVTSWRIMDCVASSQHQPTALWNHGQHYHGLRQCFNESCESRYVCMDAAHYQVLKMCHISCTTLQDVVNLLDSIHSRIWCTTLMITLAHSSQWALPTHWYTAMLDIEVFRKR